RLNYANAVAVYQTGQASAGDALVSSMLGYLSNGSVWLYQLLLVDTMVRTNNGLTERVAIELYENLLRDPSPADWLTQPMESLAVLAIPHATSYENWFEKVISRKEYERALEVADLARRHRFLSSLEFGGRLINLRWVLEAPVESLPQAAVNQRNDLLTRY